MEAALLEFSMYYSLFNCISTPGCPVLVVIVCCKLPLWPRHAGDKTASLLFLLSRARVPRAASHTELHPTGVKRIVNILYPVSNLQYNINCCVLIQI